MQGYRLNWCDILTFLIINAKCIDQQFIVQCFKGNIDPLVNVQLMVIGVGKIEIFLS